jgi:outer membrane protein TolC
VALAAGCQTYAPKPLDAEASQRELAARNPASAEVAALLRRLAEEEAPGPVDPVGGVSLEQAEAVALVFNPSLRLARLQAGVAKATADTAGIWEDPVTGVNLNDVLQRASTGLSVGAEIGFSIPISGRLEAEKERAGAAYAAELVEVQGLEWETRMTLRRAWTEWSAALARVEVLEQSLAAVSLVATLADRLEAAGEIARVEARLLRIERATVQARLVQQRAVVAEREVALRRLMGLAPWAEVRLVPAHPRPAEVPALETLRERLVAASPVIAARRARYEVAERALALEVRKQWPDIEIGPTYNTDGNEDLTFGVRFPLPLWNHNQQGVAEADAARELERARFDAALEQGLGDLQAAVTLHAGLAAQRALLEDELLPLAELQAEETRRIAELGEVNILLLLESLTQQQGARLSIIEAREAEHLARLGIARLVGPEPRAATVATTKDRAPRAAGPRRSSMNHERTTHQSRPRRSALPLLVAVLALSSCTRTPEPPPREGAAAPAARAAADGAAPAPTNRVDIPASVRQSLGITFARVEPRAVGQTLRVAGRFELLPTARREYRAPLKGRVELLVSQYQPVEAGTPLFRVESAAWRDLHEQIVGMQARVDSMGPLREAHRVHERSLAEKVQLWKDRLAQLEELRAAGGGSAQQFAEARAALNGTQAELADVMEKDAELQAQQKTLEADLRLLQARRAMLLKANAGDAGAAGAAEEPSMDSYLVRATAPGIVEAIGAVSGGLVEDSGLVVTTVQPELVRFHARGLQSDLGRLRDGLAARIVPPAGGSLGMDDTMDGTLRIGLTADADERTVDLLVQPERLAGWARAGVSAHLEITLAGGQPELAIPLGAVARDGGAPIIFRRDPADPDKAIRLPADLGVSDGRWVVVQSGVREGDEVVVGGNYQLMLATAGSAPKGGHFHADGTFHEGKD